MVKFFVILLAIFVGILIVFTYILKKIRSFFGQFQDLSAKSNIRRSEENVIYKSDDVVVLKGEAGNKEKGKDI